MSYSAGIVCIATISVYFFAVIPKQTCNAWKSQSSSSGLFRISPNDVCDIKVFCDMSLDNGDGWIVIQRRSSGSIDFEDKDWNDYVTGFGDLNGEYWMGLERLHAITSTGTYELFIGFKSNVPSVGGPFKAVYTSFSVGSRNVDEKSGYKLSVSPMDTGRSSCTESESCEDRLSPHNLQDFSTHDEDNDGDDNINCANYGNQKFGGWWFGKASNTNIVASDCVNSNLNGKYEAGGFVSSQPHNGIKWKGLGGQYMSLIQTIMAIRRV